MALRNLRNAALSSEDFEEHSTEIHKSWLKKDLKFHSKLLHYSGMK
jgi:hypothetical protein